MTTSEPKAPGASRPLSPASRPAGMAGDPYPDYDYPPTGLRPPAGTGPDGGPARVASTVSGLNVLVGLWLIVAPWVLNYRNTGDGFNGYWNDVVIGIAIAVLALARTAAPRSFEGLSWVNIALGIWLIIAPFVLAYNIGTDAPAARWNDIACGIVVLVLASVSVAATQRSRQQAGV